MQKQENNQFKQDENSESNHIKWGCFSPGQRFNLDHSTILKVTDRFKNVLRCYIQETSTRKHRLANHHLG